MPFENDHSTAPSFEEVVDSEMEVTKRFVWTHVFRRSLLPMVLRPPQRRPTAQEAAPITGLSTQFLREVYGGPWVKVPWDSEVVAKPPRARRGFTIKFTPPEIRNYKP